MSRAKNLGDNDVATIVEVLDGWSGKLTWDLLIDAVELRLFSRYTRQALDKHARIKAAFALRKATLANAGEGSRRKASSPEMQLAFDRIERLERENERLKAENNNLLEQFVRWAYNAHTRGVDETILNRPLPVVNRQQTQMGRLRRPGANVSGTS